MNDTLCPALESRMHAHFQLNLIRVPRDLALCTVMPDMHKA